jgi:hypothetical protein
MVHDTQNEEVVSTLHVEDAVGEPSKIRAPDGLVDEWKPGREGPDSIQNLFQILAEGQVQARPLLGIPGLSLGNVPMCR